MKGDRILTSLLSLQEIPNAEPALLEKLHVPEGYKSLGIVTTDCDDVSYAAIDEATKKAEVTVVYAKSFYAGSGNASTKLAGEFIGILAGEDPAEVRAGLNAFVDYIQNVAFFYSANGNKVYHYTSYNNEGLDKLFDGTTGAWRMCTRRGARSRRASTTPSTSASLCLTTMPPRWRPDSARERPRRCRRQRAQSTKRRWRRRNYLRRMTHDRR